MSFLSLMSVFIISEVSVYFTLQVVVIYDDEMSSTSVNSVEFSLISKSKVYTTK